MGNIMALLVNEQRALEKLEDTFIAYFGVVAGEDISDEIDRNKTPEERMLFLATLLKGLQ
jgi:hypothetical protein